MKLEGYSIQTSYFNAGGAHPKNWAFSASKDGVIWTKNESHVDTNNYMNQAYQSKYVDFHTNGIFRFFRIIVAGESYETHNPNRMDVNQIELFGKYFEGKYSFFTNYYLSRNRFNITFLFLILLLLS